MDERKFAQVVVDRPVPSERIFTYAVPPALEGAVVPGVRVMVPFGRQVVYGFVVDVTTDCPPGIKTREIIRVLEDKPIPAGLLTLAGWLSSRYLCTLIDALVAVSGPAPKGSKRKEAEWLWPCGDASEVLGAIEELKAPAQARALSVLAAQPGMARQALMREAGVSAGVVAALIRKGLVISEKVSLRREPYQDVALDPSPPPLLTPEQEGAFSEIEKAIAAGRPEIFFLHGVTGSGKTEVYLRAVAATLSVGRQAIVLVPEITLAHQMVLQFKARFGHQVAVTHSALVPAERHDAWERVRTGEAGVVLGARSAVFAPTARLGLIVVDEEHEPAYKQEQSPRYHAREVALARARLEGAVAVLGSATPALESVARYLSGRYRQLRLNTRVDGRPMPVVRVIDLREEFRVGNVSLFSQFLAERVREKVSQREQVLLFLNRKGFAAFVLCQACGHVIRCPNCDIALSYHRPDTLFCHYCYYRARYRPCCPRCGNERLGWFGAGTQRVEEEARALFPEARIARMDAETTARRGSHAALLDAFKRGEIDILIGTQMIAKGLDMPGVTLVGVLNADTTLLLPDFRAAERTFQLLYQVAGRAGRGPLPGEVVIQSHCPEHYAVRYSARQDFFSFARRELALRQRFGYPPYAALVRVVFSGEAEEKVVREATAFGTAVRDLVGREGRGKTVLGPAPCPFGKLKGFYRWHIILKGKNGQAVREVCREVLTSFGRRRGSGVRISVDVDPVSIL
ncbi:replication restart helicase PriA [Thermodesulfitimonas sp.]